MIKLEAWQFKAFELCEEYDFQKILHGVGVSIFTDGISSKTASFTKLINFYHIKKLKY